MGLWWAKTPDIARLAGLIRPVKPVLTSANSYGALSNPPEKRKVAGSIPALATSENHLATGGFLVFEGRVPEAFIIWGQRRLDHLSDCRCRDRSRVHIEPYARTLCRHRGPCPTNFGYAG